MLSNSPGSVGFENAPFKLPQEYLDLLGGAESDLFAEFKTLVKKAFLAVRKSAENLVLLIEMMQKGKLMHINRQILDYHVSVTLRLRKP